MESRRSLRSTAPLKETRDRRGLSQSNNVAFNLADRVKPTPLEETSTTRHQRHESAAASAKREISKNLREDWSWPPDPSQPANQLRITAATEWRERDSDSSSSPSPPPTQSSLATSNPYRYESPDSLLQPILQRKRKRHRQLWKEISWNEGLATYTRRRDAWVGARESSLETLPTGSATAPISSKGLQNSSASTSSSIASRRDSNNPSPPPLLPLPLPLLPISNSIRSSITPATYPSIYSKVVVRGITPTVPINLSDMIGALVQGWKADGEWPPTSRVPETQVEARSGIRAFVAGTRSGSGSGLARRSVGKMKRALGLGEEVGRDEG